MKVLLVFPPGWTPMMPHLALPSLAAYLRPRGIEVVQRDLNLEFIDAVLTPDHLETVPRQLRRQRLRQGSRSHSSASLPPSLVEAALADGPRLADQVERAKAVVRSDAFFDSSAGLEALQVIVQSLALASLPFHPTSLDLSDHTPAYPPDSSRALLRAVRDPLHNPFLDMFTYRFVPEIARAEPDIVAVSVPSMSQMLPTMTLAHLLKRQGIGCHITVGGPHITMLRECLPKATPIWEMIDSAIVFDGEEPLLQLAEALASGADLASVPNLIYRRGDSVQMTSLQQPKSISELPMPDFRGLPLARYLAPRLVLPLLSSRGCYHARCAFCNVGYGGPRYFSQQRAEQLAQQMLDLRTTYGAKHIFFADEAMTRRVLKGMARILENAGAPIHWVGCVRFDPGLSQSLLESMYRGGCRMLLFGLESASQEVLTHIMKGTRPATASRILRQSAKAGIWNHLFFFFGFPGETIEQAQETVNFLYGHQDCIHSAAFGTFLLERYSPVHKSPEAFGVKRMWAGNQKDLAIYFDYEVEKGMDEATASLLAERFLDALPDRQEGHLYAHDVYRFLYASRLSDQCLSPPVWLGQ